MAKAHYYKDGTIVELGDRCETDVDSLLYEPEPAMVETLGKNKIQVRYDNENVKPRTEWLKPGSCELISRAM